MRYSTSDRDSSLLVGATTFHVHALGADTDSRCASARPPSTFFISFASCREADNTESVACELSSCWREEGGEEEAERGEKCWKNADASAGSSALHSGDASVMASMLPSIQPCTSEVRGSGQSG
jgi:hypothetical protein